MASGISYRRFEQGTALVVPLGTAAAPSLLFGNDNAWGGMNDGIYATTGPAVGIAINGTSVLTINSTGIASATGITTTGAVATGALTVTGAASATGAILSSSATGGIGYSTGAGGAVTQSTDKSTTVTLNTVTGAITMHNEAHGALVTKSFTVTNSAVGINDVILVNHGSAGTAGAYLVQANTITAGSFKISVYNYSDSSLSEAIVLNFAVVQGVAA